MIVGNRSLRFEAEFPCDDCDSLIRLQTYRAVVEGPGQLVVCRHCKRPYRVFRILRDDGSVYEEGAEKLPKHSRIRDMNGLPPLPTSLNVAQPPHKIQTLPLNPSVCYVCMIPVSEHPPEPQLFIPGGRPEGM